MPGKPGMKGKGLGGKRIPGPDKTLGRKPRRTIHHHGQRVRVAIGPQTGPVVDIVTGFVSGTGDPLTIFTADGRRVDIYNES